MKTAARTLAGQTGDLPAMLASGFGWMHGSRFSLLTLRDPARTCTWLRALLASGVVKTARDLSACGRPSESIDEVVSVALSAEGLRRLGLRELADARLPTPFAAGMGSAARAKLLRDTPRDGWNWSDGPDAGRRSVHLLVAHWWRLGKAAPHLTAMPPFDPAAFDVASIEGDPTCFRGGKLFEPFGFRDGLSQPLIDGLRGDVADAAGAARSDAGEYFGDRIVAPGEFILGQTNEYGEPAASFDLKGWTGDATFGANGSFLAVRQIDQRVDAFRPLNHIGAGTAAGMQVTLAEKLVGRRRDDHGTPLGWRLSRCPVSDSEADAFRYARDDAEGFDCPLGAHVRRANPRDGLGHDIPAGIESSKLHRLLRRGRPYREVRDGIERQGLFFIACNADLERQFEFVHQRWMHNPRFADLEDEEDPMLGSTRGRPDHPFAVPARPTGQAHSLAEYTSTVGGGYFFLPGLAALEFIADSPWRG